MTEAATAAARTRDLAAALGSPLRTLLVSSRDTLDGWLHRSRRRRARARLRGLSPARVLFVCLGNVCRSPYGERVWLRSAGRGRPAESAGFIGPGRSPPDTALDVARARGIDHGDHRSRAASAEMLRAADAVFVFDRLNVAHLRATRFVPARRILWLGDFDPKWVGKRAIIDPWGKSASDFERTFERIERCVADAVEALGVGQDGSGP